MNDILNELLIGLKSLMDEQTDKLIQEQRKTDKNMETINVVASGSTLSILDTVMKNSEASGRINSVATSFGVLNEELKKMEDTLHELGTLSVNGQNLSAISDIVKSLSIIGTINVDNLKNVSKIKKKHIKNITGFLNTFSEEMKGIEFPKDDSVKNIKSLMDLVSTMVKPDFVKNLKRANRVYKKYPGIGYIINPTNIPKWIKEFIKEFKGLKSDENLEQSLKNVNSIIQIVSKISKPSFITKLVFANMVYTMVSTKNITNFIKNFITELNGALSKKQKTLENLKRDITTFSEIVQLVINLTKHIIVLGFLGVISVLAIPGLVLTGLMIKTVTMIFKYLRGNFKKFTKSYRDSIIRFGECVRKLCDVMAMIVVLTLVSKLVDFNGLGHLALVLGATFGVFMLLVVMKKIMPSVRKSLINVCQTLAWLSLAIVGLTVATILAGEIEPENFKYLLGVIGIMAIIAVGLWVLSRFPIISGAIMMAMGLAGVMVVVAIALVAVLNVLRLCKYVYKDLPYIQMVIEGFTEIMLSISAKAVWLGIISPLLVAFAGSVFMLMLTTVSVILVAKLARMFKPEDRKSIKDVVTSMTEVFGIIEDYFNSRSFFGKFPVLGAVDKLVNAYGASVSLILFSVSISALMLSVGLTILVSKMSRWVEEEDKISLRNLITEMTKIFKNIDDYFSSTSFISGIPIIGAVDKLFNAFGASISLILFAVSISILMLVTMLVIGVTKMAKTVKKEDRDALEGVVDSMINIFKKINKDLWGPLSFIGDIGIAGFLAGITPVIALMDKYIGLVKKYDATVKELRGKTPGQIGLQMAQDLLNFYHAIDDNVHVGDWISSNVTSAFMKSIQPMMVTIGKFVDVVAKVASATYLVGYDEKGKPLYVKIEPETFEKAASAVTTGFMGFITELDITFKVMESDISPRIIKNLGKAMMPMMESISKFADAIIKLATGTYTEGYDEQGRPITKLIAKEQYKNAAEVLTDNFCTFLITLGVLSGTKINYQTQNTLNSLRKAILPVMDSVSSFADAIIKLATGTYVDGYDKDGKPKYKKISAKEYETAAGTIAKCFTNFIEELHTKLQPISGNIEDIFDDLMDDNGIMTIMTTATDFVSRLVDIVTKNKNLNIATIGTDLSKGFCGFLTNFVNQYNQNQNAFNKIPEMIQKINSMNTMVDIVMETVKRFNEFMKYDFDAILKKEKAFHNNLNYLMTIDMGKFSKELKTHVDSIITTLNKFDYALEKSTKKVNAFRIAAVKTVKDIEKSLKENESSRNRRFKDLVTNLDNVSSKLGVLKTGIDNLKNNGFDEYIRTISEAVNDLRIAQEELSEYQRNGIEGVVQSYIDRNGVSVTQNGQTTVVGGSGGSGGSGISPQALRNALEGTTLQFTYNGNGTGVLRLAVH